MSRDVTIAAGGHLQGLALEYQYESSVCSDCRDDEDNRKANP